MKKPHQNKTEFHKYIDLCTDEGKNTPEYAARVEQSVTSTTGIHDPIPAFQDLEVQTDFDSHKTYACIDPGFCQLCGHDFNLYTTIVISQSSGKKLEVGTVCIEKFKLKEKGDTLEATIKKLKHNKAKTKQLRIESEYIRSIPLSLPALSSLLLENQDIDTTSSIYDIFDALLQDGSDGRIKRIPASLVSFKCQKSRVIQEEYREVFFNLLGTFLDTDVKNLKKLHFS